MWSGTGKYAGGHELRELNALKELERDLDRIPDTAPADMTPEECEHALVRMRRQIDQYELKFARFAASYAATAAHDEDLMESPLHWIRSECHMTGYAGANAICVGEQAEHLPESTAAMRRGDIGFPHLALLARTAEAVRNSPTGGTFDEAPLLQMARVHAVNRFRRDCAHARHAADARAFLTEQNELAEARFLEFQPRADGAMWIRGFLDPEAAAVTRTAIEPLARRTGRDDPRPRGQRLADGFVELVSHRLDSGGLPQRDGQRPHVQITASIETVAGTPRAPAGEMEFAGPIAAETVRRYSCSAAISRVLLAADSTVVDVGRERRVPSAAARRALHVRDKGCVWPSCDRCATWTTPHHVIHWSKDGPTDLENLVLLCYHHHRRVHEDGWQLVRTADRGVLTIPPPSEFKPVPWSPRTVENGVSTGVT